MSVIMADTSKAIVDREMLMQFNLGEPVVLACGGWEGARWIHEEDAVFDQQCGMYVENDSIATGLNDKRRQDSR